MDINMDKILEHIKRVIETEGLYDWLKDFPWYPGYWGDLNAPVWFIGENPSLTGLKRENMQRDSHEGERLFRESLTECGFKTGDPYSNEGWNCYRTNVIKEPEHVGARNKKGAQYSKSQALVWLSVLQQEIDAGKPMVLVAVGNKAYSLLMFMKKNGLRTPDIDMIPHYSYIMYRPDSKTGLGPRHPGRIKNFKENIERIKKKYLSNAQKVNYT